MHTTKQRHGEKASVKAKRQVREEGARDFAAAISTSQCPYARGTDHHDWWLHGWWGAYYKQRDARIEAGELCSYCAGPMEVGYVIGKHGTTRTVCEACKDDFVYWDDYQVMGQFDAT